MPRTPRKAAEPVALVVALDSLWSAINGVEFYVGRGDRLHADHPVVLQAPRFFAPEGHPTAFYANETAKLHHRDAG
jgi:hypothetical protein